MENPSHRANALPRSERLRGRGAVSRLFAEGESGFIFPIRYVWIARDSNSVNDRSADSVLFTVPKRFHKRANRRNLLRRRVKEAYRLQKGILADSDHTLDIALIYSAKDILEYDVIFRAITKILTKISEHNQEGQKEDSL